MDARIIAGGEGNTSATTVCPQVAEGNSVKSLTN